MARNTTQGTKQLGIDIDEELLTEWKEWVKARGESQRDALELAIRRHMKYPPPAADVPPLPDARKK